MINSKTSFLALIGNPVNHSLSPIMQNAAIKYLGLNLIYLSIPCKNKDFEMVINSLKKINCVGLNVTIPYKEKVVKHCSEISLVAKKIKAINTLKLNDNLEWNGTNTDVAGLIYPLKKSNLNLRNGIILGSGGAARSAIQGLIDLKVSVITVVSRNEIALANLINDFKHQVSIKGLIFNDLKIQDLINDADLIINTTPVGMVHIEDNEQLPFGINFWNSLHQKTTVYDLIYNPCPTPLLKYCKKKGCETIDGSEMLIAQGIESLAFWTNGLRVPFEIMRDALKDYL